MRNAKIAVRDGYDKIADTWAQDPFPGDYLRPWLSRLVEGLAPGGRILDLGCGSGNPEVVPLSSAYRLVGFDLSRSLLGHASRRMPEADLVEADLGSLELAEGCADAIVALHSIIHVPRAEHAILLAKMARWLRPGGRALIVLGAGDTPIGWEDDWFGVPMYWSHFDADTGLEMLATAGFKIETWAVQPDPPDPLGGAHLFTLSSVS